MKTRITRLLAGLPSALLFVLLLSMPARAARPDAAYGTEPPEAVLPAEEITAACAVTMDGQSVPAALLDGNRYSYFYLAPGTMEITAETDMGGVYLKFDMPPGPWLLEADGQSVACGENEYIHEYVTFPAARRVTLTFSEKITLAGLRVYSPGEPPSGVQTWQPPLERADILMVPTHSDDDSLYFAGIVETCADRGIAIQVAFNVNHWNSRLRTHELLDGLWMAGMRNYPVIGQLPDIKTENLNEAITRQWNAGYPYDDIVGIQVELLRRFRPQIVLSHDLNGEYGHGQHILNADTLLRAVSLASDAGSYPESAEEYGVWDVPKTYVHLYGENQVVLDLDVPLPTFGGKTAYQVAQEVFQCYPSQFEWNGFYWWLYYYDRCSQVSAGNYSPCFWGLWRSLVGPDTLGNTFMENIVTYAEQERLAEEARLAEIEATRLAEEAEAARLAEEARAARLAEAEAKQEQEQAAANAEALRLSAQHSRRVRATVAGGGLLLALPAIFLWLRYWRERRRDE